MSPLNLSPAAITREAEARVMGRLIAEEAKEVERELQEKARSEQLEREAAEALERETHARMITALAELRPLYERRAAITTALAPILRELIECETALASAVVQTGVYRLSHPDRALAWSAANLPGAPEKIGLPAPSDDGARLAALLAQWLYARPKERPVIEFIQMRDGSRAIRIGTNDLVHFRTSV